LIVRLPWSALHRIAFRFVFVYLILYYLPDILTRPLDSFFAVRFFGFRSPMAYPQPNGSGDTAVAYIHAFSVLVIALVAKAA
jgi:hypothetical protein